MAHAGLPIKESHQGKVQERSRGVAAMDEQERRRHRQAVEIHDDVVQALAMAKISLELGETEAGMVALEGALEAARRIVTDLLDEGEVLDLTDGLLRRDSPAGLG